MTDAGVWAVHDEACARGEHSYSDPETGFQVFTRVGLLARGRCCGAGCRHCPYAHGSVPLHARPRRAKQATWLTAHRPAATGTVNLLFWSGGKDSYLAYRALQREGYAVTLLTTYDAATGVIAHQEFSIERVVTQATQLGLPLVGVPLHPSQPYLEALQPAFELVGSPLTLCFGDLHLRHIREWREEAFGTHPATAHMPLSFPLWDKPYDELLDDLERSGATCEISAITDETLGLRLGEPFDRALVARLPAHADAFGERGEFHTLVSFG